MKIELDIYTTKKIGGKNLRINHLILTEEDILKLAESKFIENPPVEFQNNDREIYRIEIDKWIL